MIRTTRDLLLVVAAAVLALAIPAFNNAEATTVAKLTVEQFTDASSYIIKGEAGESWTSLNDRGLVYTHTKVTVDEVYKGPNIPDEVVVSVLGGTFGSISTEIAGRPVFSTGERVFLFLHESPSGALIPVAQSTGKYTIRRAPGETRHHVLRVVTGKKYDHRFLPHPRAEDRVYLDDLVEKVQSRLDTGWDGKAIPGISLDELEKFNTTERRMPR
ncbi:MAG: hypothetical protein HN348_16920 [Proteobacteria bacterium]|jgi:hypothetical protein|nr:hypothetical protein [Pseudomonadota bacterium]